MGARRVFALTGPPALLAAAMLAAWQAASATGWLARYILPSPLAVLQAALASPDVLLRHALATAGEALAGFALGNLVALVLALVVSASAWARICLYPLALLSRGLPIVAIAPLIVISVGRGLPSIVAVVALSVAFPTLINMAQGLEAARAEYFETMHALSANRWQRLRLFTLPAATPYLIAALKVSASGAVINAVVAEWIGSNLGLGYLVVISGQYFKLPMMWAAIAAAAALTLALIGAVALFEKVCGRYAAAPAEIQP